MEANLRTFGCQEIVQPLKGLRESGLAVASDLWTQRQGYSVACCSEARGTLPTLALDIPAARVDGDAREGHLLLRDRRSIPYGGVSS